MRLGAPIFLLIVGLIPLGWVSVEMYLGRPLDLIRNKFEQIGLLVLSAVAFLFFIWWIFAMIRQAKSVAARGAKRG